MPEERGIVSKSKLTALANKIKAAAGESGSFTLDELAALDISGGSQITTQPLTVSTNGTYTAPSGTAYTPVTVAVPVPTYPAAESNSFGGGV